MSTALVRLEHEDAAGIRMRRQRQEFQHRGLARSALADERHHLFPCHFETGHTQFEDSGGARERARDAAQNEAHRPVSQGSAPKGMA